MGSQNDEIKAGLIPCVVPHTHLLLTDLPSDRQFNYLRSTQTPEENVFSKAFYLMCNFCARDGRSNAEGKCLYHFG